MADVSNLRASVEKLIADVRANFDAAVAKAVADAEAGVQAAIDALQGEVDTADASLTPPVDVPPPETV